MPTLAGLRPATASPRCASAAARATAALRLTILLCCRQPRAHAHQPAVHRPRRGKRLARLRQLRRGQLRLSGRQGHRRAADLEPGGRLCTQDVPEQLPGTVPVVQQPRPRPHRCPTPSGPPPFSSFTPSPARTCAHWARELRGSMHAVLHHVPSTVAC